MKSKKIIKNIKIMIVFFVIAISIISFCLTKKCSNYIYSASLNETTKNILPSLSYKLEINDLSTETFSVSPGNSVTKITIKSINEIDSYYSLLYLNNDNVNVYYIDNDSNGFIKAKDEVELYLFISNNSDSIIKMNLGLIGKYNENDIVVDNGYTEITNQIKVGDYIDYVPSGIENVTKYNLLSVYGGTKYNQEVYLQNSKYRIFNINLDGTIDIISENSLFIDEYDTKLELNGSVGYNNSILILNDIVSSIYSNSDIVKNARNLSINDIVDKLNISATFVTNNYSYDNIYYPNYSDSISTNSYLYGKYNVTENYYKIDIDKSNYKNEIYYDLINTEEEYFLSNSYVIKNDNVRYGIYSVYNNKVDYNDLYYSNNETKSFKSKIRPIITLSSNIELRYNYSIWNIK